MSVQVRGVAVDLLARRVADIGEQVNDAETTNDEANELLENAYQSLREAQAALEEAQEVTR